MKNNAKLTDQVTIDKPIQFPEFWTEEWIQVAIDVLEKSNMPTEERATFEMILAHNATTLYAYEEEKKRYADRAVKRAVRKQQYLAEKKIQEERQLAEQKVQEERQLAEQKSTIAVLKMLELGMQPAIIAQVQNMPIEKILAIQKQEK